MCAYIGIDLAASEKRCSGVAVIADKRIETVLCLSTDRSIVSFVDAVRARWHSIVMAIDAPLSLPRSSRGYRQVDKEVIKLGYRVLPISFRGMEMLTKRGIRLAQVFRSMGIKVLETHPRSALKSSGCSDLKELVEVLRIEGFIDYGKRDLYDSVICAIVAFCADAGCAYEVRAQDGSIWLLKKLC